MTASVHAEGGDSVEGRKRRIAGAMGIATIPDMTEVFTFGLIITKHRHCTFHSTFADRKTNIAFFLV